MLAVAYAAALYLVLLALLRLAGKRTMAQMTPFDLVLLLIIAEATQQAFLGEDFSLVRALVVVATLVAVDVLLSYLKQAWRPLGKAIDGVPLVILEDGELIREIARRERVDESDVLEAAREKHGLERLEQVKYAVLERSGGISIIPR